MVFKKKQDKRSPLENKDVLRNPGESLERERERLFYEELLPYASIAVFAVIFAVFEWWLWFTHSPPEPVGWTIFALGVTAYTVYKTLLLRRQSPSLWQGIDGEKFVGQYLEGHKVEGSRVFHDIPANDFNVDHVVVSRQGIFVIETKTFSKPFGRKAEIKFVGGKIFVDGKSPDRDPIEQARACSDWLRKFLLNETARNFPTRGIVVFPGWWVDPMPRNKPDIWVLTPEAVPVFIQKEPAVLTIEDVALVASRISDYVQKHL